MLTRNINVPLRLLVLGISLASTLQYRVLASNVTTVVTPRPTRPIERLSIAHPAELLATTTPRAAAAAAAAVVDEIIQDQIIGILDRPTNKTTYSLTGLTRAGNSIKKGGGAAGSRGSGGSSSNVGNGGNGNGMSSSGSSGILGSSTSLEYPVWFPLGGGLFEPPPSSANAIIGSTVALRAVALACGTVLTVYSIL
ncbi:hypothetical protein EKO27_g1415 [Xylaria grammica]|uniref:Uncharacterized protein n=1 Tax=Xylaria grammica TaxID=363999 RepID=A0A439DH13_9PEZI|nr:hypothetical protein EKO27_g1415 [Xylaria grammica]